MRVCRVNIRSDAKATYIDGSVHPPALTNNAASILDPPPDTNLLIADARTGVDVDVDEENQPAMQAC